jgi:hypothetical protein
MNVVVKNLYHTIKFPAGKCREISACGDAIIISGAHGSSHVFITLDFQDIMALRKILKTQRSINGANKCYLAAAKRHKPYVDITA